MGARLLALTVAAAVVAAGCLAGVQPNATPAKRNPGGAAAVVAVIDSGINPYHEVFRSADGAEDAAAFADRLGINVIPMNLTLAGSWEDRVAADEALWAAVEPGSLYAFVGTRVMAYAAHPGTDQDVPKPLLMDDRSGRGHGTAVASQVMLAAPQSMIVMIQGDSSLCGVEEQGRCIGNPSMPAGVAWAASQPWVDVISMSWGSPGNAPRPQALFEDRRELVAATRSAVGSGKLVVVAAGNEPSMVAFDNTDGPPWTISVGGWNPYQHGPVLFSSRGVDVAANYTVVAPTSNSTDSYWWTVGTSFSTPLVAGTIADAVTRLRESVLHQGGIKHGALAVGPNGERFTNTDVRDALNASAWLPPLEGYDPTASPAADNDTTTRNKVLQRLAEFAEPNVAPAATVGWGVVDGRITADVVRRVIEHDFAVPSDKQAVAELRAQHQAAREAYWGTGGL